MKITLCTTSTYKLHILEAVAKMVYPDTGIEINQVSTEISHKEAFTEEDHRVALQENIEGARKEVADSTIYVSMLGGMREFPDGIYEVAGVLAVTQEDEESFSSCTSFKVPNNIAEQVRSGISFAAAIKPLFNEVGKPEDGFVSLLTGGSVTKYDQYHQAAVVALSQIKKRELLYS